MFTVRNDLLTLLRTRSRNLHYVYELYEWNYVPFPDPTFGNLSYDPRFAIARWAGAALSFTWNAQEVAYVRIVTKGGAVHKSMGKKFDSLSLTCSNVQENEDGFRYLANFVLTHRVQGMKLVKRMIPRNADSLSVVEASASPFTHSIILFVGRCDKPDGFDREQGTISAKQDLGTIEAQIPERDFQPQCPLVRVFKKPGDCLGNETLSQKSPTYQAAKKCNGTLAQCLDYDNERYYQGTHIIQIQSSFVHKSNESFFKKVLNILPGISRKKTTVGNSVFDGTPYGKPIPVILGRWKKELVHLQYQDLDTTINFKAAACRGPIKDFLNIRNESPNFSQPGSIIKHLGEYGGVGTQTADMLFPGGEFHSKLAYFTGSCTGSDIISEDPAPVLSSVVAGQRVRQATGAQANVSPGTGKVDSSLAGYANGADGWSDNPVDLTRAILTDNAYLNLPETSIGELETAITSIYTTSVVKDLSNAERCLLPSTESAHAGIDYKRYNSTGLLGALSFYGTDDFLFQAQRPGGYWAREAEYEFFDPNSPPTSLDVKTFYRKRYTCNIEINEKKKAIDFVYDTLLACYRGFFRWDRHGRLVIDCERPADHSFLRANAAITATSIKVRDVTPWAPFDGLLTLPSPLRGKILIGAHKNTSEVRPVTSAQYSADGNAITLAASSTSGTMTAVTSGATLSGGSSSVAASGSVVISGSCAVGDVITITVDGFAVSLTTTQEDVDASIDNLTVASQLTAMINAEPILREYVEARRSGSNPTSVELYSKYGVLNFVTALQEAHFAELADPVDAPSASTSAGSLAAGTYLLTYAYRNANGNTNFSPILAIELADNEQIDVDAITPLLAGVDSVDWFVSVEADSDTRLLVLNNDGSAFSIDALPATTATNEPVRNTTGEEILRVIYSDAQKALTYADTTRATHLDGSFKWPEGGRQSTVNQAKGKYREAIMDFAETPWVVNDETHQAETNQVNPVEIDLSAVDNHWQAVYLLNGYLAKHRDLDFFFLWGAAGEPLLLEIGDVMCLSDDSGSWRNVPVRVEEIEYNDRFEASFTCRLYSTHAFDRTVEETQVPLSFDLPNFLGPAPDISFNEVDFPPDGLEQSTDGSLGITSIRGGAIFGDTVYPGQWAKVRLLIRAGVAVSEVVVTRIEPDSNLEAVFEFLASADGLYRVELEVFSGRNVPNPTKPTADIIIGFGTLFGIAKQGGVLITKQGGTIMEQPHV